MTQYSSLPIVGAYYRPPAQAICSVLAVGTPLFLSAEPDNPADPNAISVWVESTAIPHSTHQALANALMPYGFTLDQILEAESWHLGYIQRQVAAKLKASGVVGDEPVSVLFFTSAEGKPRIEFPSPVFVAG